MSIASEIFMAGVRLRPMFAIPVAMAYLSTMPLPLGIFNGFFIGYMVLALGLDLVRTAMLRGLLSNPLLFNTAKDTLFNTDKLFSRFYVTAIAVCWTLGMVHGFLLVRLVALPMSLAVMSIGLMGLLVEVAMLVLIEKQQQHILLSLVTGLDLRAAEPLPPPGETIWKFITAGPAPAGHMNMADM
jgi:hypothetical protein